MSAAAQPYRIERSTRASRVGLALSLVAVAALVALPLWGDGGSLRLIVEIAYYLALAQSWNLLAGYGGLVSIGQQAFVGLGAYAMVALTTQLGVHPLIALPLGGLAAALMALPTALVAFRLRGAYFAIGTWVLAEVYRLLIAQDFTLGGGTGMSLPVSVITAIGSSRALREIILYYIALALGWGSVLVVFLWLRSRLGLALTAIRDSAAAAASIGINNGRTKLAVYAVAAGLAGLVGALAFIEKVRISPNAAFSLVDWTANVIFIVVIGGIGSIEGPIIGTVVFFALRGLLADFGPVYLILLGLIAIAVMLVAPRGLWGLVQHRLGIELFPVQRRVRLLDETARRGPTDAQPG